MQLIEYIKYKQAKGEDISYASIAKDIPCHYSYIGKIVEGKRKPSYEMARRIEQITNGEVSRYNWYPKE